MKFVLEYANKFDKISRNANEVFVGFIETISASGECNFTHRIVYRDVLETIINKRNLALLNEIQTCYISIFDKPKYPIIQNFVSLSIGLVDEKLPPPKRKLYPLSEPKQNELRKLLKALVDSSRIVPSASPYGVTILFAAKMGGFGLQMCTEYRSLNSNTATDSFSLPRIAEILVHLCSSKMFSKLDLGDGYHQILIAQENSMRQNSIVDMGRLSLES